MKNLFKFDVEKHKIYFTSNFNLVVMGWVATHLIILSLLIGRGIRTAWDISYWALWVFNLVTHLVVFKASFRTETFRDGLQMRIDEAYRYYERAEVSLSKMKALHERTLSFVEPEILSDYKAKGVLDYANNLITEYSVYASELEEAVDYMDIKSSNELDEVMIRMEKAKLLDDKVSTALRALEIRTLVLLIENGYNVEEYLEGTQERIKRSFDFLQRLKLFGDIYGSKEEVDLEHLKDFSKFLSKMVGE